MVTHGCDETDESKLSQYTWLAKTVETIKQQPVGNPPQEVWQFEYDGKIVIYIAPSCCDMMSELFDEIGNKLCAPDGGITGMGDGKCPDFFEKRKNPVLLWKDSRSR